MKESDYTVAYYKAPIQNNNKKKIKQAQEQIKQRKMTN
jgi:hypothetical protein